MPRPPGAHEGSPTWDVIDAALAELEANADLQILTDRAAIIGLLCLRLAEAEAHRERVDPAELRAEFVTALEAAARAGFGDATWQAAAPRRYSDADLEEARRQAGLVELRVQQGGITTEQAAEYLLRLAEGLRPRT